VVPGGMVSLLAESRSPAKQAKQKLITTFLRLFADLVVIFCDNLSIYLDLTNLAQRIVNPVV
jgi:hypothetical protein